MNLLAHALLSPADPDVLTGNIIADWVKGRARLVLPPAIQAGFALHRRIDLFTDTHPLVAQCGVRLEPRWGRYSTVLVDIFFDHLLAANWNCYTNTTFSDFVPEVYQTLQAHRESLPERANFGICALTMDDWFRCYATLDGIRLTLTRMSARLRHNIELAPAVRDFDRHRDFFENAFRQFFPQIQHAMRQRAEVAA